MPPRKSITVETTVHKVKRTNIPTQELSDFMTDEQKAPVKLLYPRDPSLDPQLVWKGKDEQDSQDLIVEGRPIYIQEKIHPKVIIENVKAQAKEKAPQLQLDLFADFNGIEFENQIDFYQHQQNWTNRMILGDSLQVMASLAEKEGLKGQVQMIYIDPPYGIRFGSNWQVSTIKRSVKDGKIEDLTRQPEQVKAFRDTWELGIHSYLAYLRDRLVGARELLTESGSIFVQIGDENVHLVRSLLDEVFGSENFCRTIVVSKTSGQTDKLVANTTDYVLWYSKDTNHVKYRQLFWEKWGGESGSQPYQYLELPNGTRRRMTAEEYKNISLLPPKSRIFRLSGTSSMTRGASVPEPFSHQNQVFFPEKSRGWSTTIGGLSRLVKAERIRISGSTIAYVRFLDDFPVYPMANYWHDTGTGSFTEDKIYVVQTGTKIIERCVLMTTDPGDLVLDPTCGSGTTAYVAEQWGRRWITTDTSRVALALARTRLMSGRFPYYILADSPAGVDLMAEQRGQLPPRPMPDTYGDIRQGFVYKTVPHVTLKAIANNEEIDAIHARWQEKLEPIHSKLDQLLKQNWQEWEIPREAAPNWPAEAGKLLEQWWQLRRERQTEIDASIARNSDRETLYDQPFEDNKVVRVTGPFTVESLSPHRAIISDQLTASEKQTQDDSNIGQFEELILENLREAGVQNTKQGERLVFDRLEVCAGAYVQAEGEYTEKDGTVKRVAVALGPEQGTVGKDLIKFASREAVKGLSADLLLVCGFAFDPDVNEEARNYGRLTVLPVRMNPDLTMANVLKKTKSANLFMVFGEPDLTVEQAQGKVTVSLHGLDIYDPTTGEIRSSSTKDIACWFIDTNYDGNSFFVRHAYFTGGDEPYDKLKRALRAEIDEDAWSALYRTTSIPFDLPDTGKIAVKVINHYGDEVLKVYEVAV